MSRIVDRQTLDICSCVVRSRVSYIEPGCLRYLRRLDWTNDAEEHRLESQEAKSRLESCADWMPPMSSLAERAGRLFLRGVFFVKTIPPYFFCVSGIVSSIALILLQ